jgi:hypothetical protein
MYHFLDIVRFIHKIKMFLALEWNTGRIKVSLYIIRLFCAIARVLREMNRLENLNPL